MGYQRVADSGRLTANIPESGSTLLNSCTPLPPRGSSKDMADRPRDASPNPIIATRGTRSGLSILRWWIPEIVTSSLSIVALLTIVIVLRVYANRSLNDVNLPFGLTLNGLIAALSAFDRVFLTVPVGSALSQEAWLWFSRNSTQSNPRSRLQDLTLSDSASRGVWGSFIFIFFCRRRWLALFGALITVLSLSINTVTQQLVSIQKLSVDNINSPLNPGNIPRSEIYNGTGSDLQESNYGPSLNVLAPVNDGFFAEAVLPVAPICPTGNCTFPNTPTLAICGACAPITFQKTLCEPQYQFCNYTTPSGSNFSILDHNATTPTQGIGMWSTTTLGQHWNASSLDTLYLANWDMMYFPYGITSKQSPNSTLNAVECAMWMCVNTYSTTVQSGVHQQQLISSYSRTNLSKVENQTQVINQTCVFSLPSNDSSPNTDFLVDVTTFSSLNSAFTDKLSGQVVIGVEGFVSDQDTMISLWNSTTFQDEWIARFTTTLTNHVRTTVPASKVFYDGTAFQLGIIVRWWWLALPVAMVAMSMLLLILVIIQTARSEVKSWKASPLTLLLFDVDGAIRKDTLETGWPDEEGAAERGVGDRGVVLRRNKIGGWYFRGT